jgi:ubiquinone biosynthesis protein
VLPIPTSEAIRVLEEETGKKMDQIFSYFEEKPIGSASIGQVHKGRLVTGELVVVKVQRPGVKAMIEADLQIIKDVVVFGDNYFKKQGILNAMEIVESFEKTMQKEVLYLTEARAMDQFRNFYKDNKEFYVPRPFKELSTDRVLFIEFIEGCKITDVRQLHEWGLDPTAVAEVGMNIYLTQIFEFGYFHADPHPGNVLVQRDGRIVLIDFGMVGKMQEADKYAFAGIFIAMANGDARQMAQSLRSLAIEHDIKDMRRLEMDLSELIENFAYLDVDESSISDVSKQLQNIIYKNQMVVPGGVFLIFRALAILEGIGKTIHPHFNTMEKVKPFGRKLLVEQYRPARVLREASWRFQSLFSLLTTLPTELKNILRQIRKGKFKIELEHLGLGLLMDKLDAVGNRLSLAMITAALLVSASLVVSSDPKYGQDGGVPRVGVVLYSLAGIVGFFLFLNIMRSGNNNKDN